MSDRIIHDDDDTCVPVVIIGKFRTTILYVVKYLPQASMTQGDMYIEIGWKLLCIAADEENTCWIIHRISLDS